MSLLSVNKLSCVKRDRILFEELGFSMQAGELLHVQGPNGAGKTSLLRLLVGLSLPDSGSIQWRGEDIRRTPGQYQSELCYFGHKLGVNLALNAIDNLRFWCRMQGLPANQDLYPLLETLGLVGLEELPAGQLSAGQQRRIALARFWLKSCPLWVLDEPFTALDKQAVALLKSRLAEHLQSQGLIIMTSHQSLDFPLPVRELHLEYRL
ncbi:cytochrome c biogenesis heme-transporting ATPase CcmA [Bowmanella sp. Y26]|uniref:cytochrome c biogenesis heme-transporting ATPase CcmA n=1 Tax=Bowmanella yangjiangensis TaxID=2811230 RepID=UPI001BDD2C71|nr:cytochrome c biogenesis heme-transporting ATPase CcmA [Bowmanella yangjiangensis]MBT1062685.1 cytochrome c biogenesis heme-transporting ATPase CcmA [Bowmanella yangjiangensis]